MAFFIRSHRWLGGIVPYEIKLSGFPDGGTMVQDAINHWTSNTILKFRPRAGEHDYVRIVADSSIKQGGNSPVGRRGGGQWVKISPFNDDKWPTVHELGHAIGMHHERQRPDRNDFVIVTKPKDKDNVLLPDGIPVGPFDSDSTMSPTTGDDKFSYKPGFGNSTLHGLSPGDVKGVAYVYHGSLGRKVHEYHWTKGWTTAFHYVVNGKDFMFFLKVGNPHDKYSGAVDIHEVNLDGGVGAKVIHYDWTFGWTTGFYYEVNGKPFMFFLKSLEGAVDIHHVNPDGTVGEPVTPRYEGWFGWTTAFHYVVNDKHFMFFLKAGDGAVDIRHVNSDGTVGALVKHYDWSPGWTTAFHYAVNGKHYMFFLKVGNPVVDFFKQTGGVVHIHEIKSDGTVGDKIEEHMWRSGWTTGLFYQVAGNPYMFFVRARYPFPFFRYDHNIAVTQVLGDGKIGPDLERYDWSDGWTTAFHYEVNSKHYILFLMRDSGLVRIYRVGVDP